MVPVGGRCDPRRRHRGAALRERPEDSAGLRRRDPRGHLSGDAPRGGRAARRGRARSRRDSWLGRRSGDGDRGTGREGRRHPQGCRRAQGRRHPSRRRLHPARLWASDVLELRQVPARASERSPRAAPRGGGAAQGQGRGPLQGEVFARQLSCDRRFWEEHLLR